MWFGVLFFVAACAGSAPRPPAGDGRVEGGSYDLLRPDLWDGGSTIEHGADDLGPPDLAPAKTVVRLSGTTRMATAAAASKAGWSSATDVVVASGKDTAFPDGIVAPPLAHKYGGPILVTDSLGGCSAGDVLLAELARLGAQTVRVVGGASSVSDTCLGAIKAVAPGATRISGADRYATAAAVAAAVGAPSTHSATVVTGLDYPDGVAAGAGSARAGMPILLVQTSSVPTATSDALTTLGITSTLVVGGPSVVSTAGLPAPLRVYGATRCDTSVEVTKHAAASLGLGYTTLVVASGASFADGVVGAALGARLGASILLTPNSAGTATTLCSGARSLISQHKQEIATVYIVGGTSSIDTAVQAEITALLK